MPRRRQDLRHARGRAPTPRRRAGSRRRARRDPWPRARPRRCSKDSRCCRAAAVDHLGLEFGEFDLDAALARNPRLILVDELAHTNAPGSRHAKRWQDVAELLDAGIDVYTTLNVQHWESLNDVVSGIIGRVIRETIPDTFLRRADEIELIDLPPEDLLQRLREGKVYRGGTAGRAAESFFRTGNLIALRELALRHVAEHVDAQMQAFRERHAIPGIWAVGERLLVGISSGPMTARLIRATARLATRLHGAWIAAYVETPSELGLPAEDHARVIDNLRLAESLGAETITRSGQSVTEELLLLAKERNVTKIVLGKPARPRWKELFQGSVVNEMARRSGDTDLYVISGFGSEMSARRAPAIRKPPPWEGIAWGIASVTGSTLLSWPLFRVVDRANLIMIYLLGVSWVAYQHGRIPALVASAASVLAFDFFFVPPYLTFSVSDTQYLFTFAAMIGVGILISTIADRLRRQNEQMRRREDRAADALPAEPGTLRDPGAATAPRDRPAAYRGVLSGARRDDHAGRRPCASRSPPETPPAIRSTTTSVPSRSGCSTTRRSPAPGRTRSAERGDSTSRCAARSPPSACSASSRMQA